jgi:hypothetical protein
LWIWFRVIESNFNLRSHGSLLGSAGIILPKLVLPAKLVLATKLILPASVGVAVGATVSLILATLLIHSLVHPLLTLLPLPASASLPVLPLSRSTPAETAVLTKALVTAESARLIACALAP